MNNQTKQNDPLNGGQFEDTTLKSDLRSIWLGWKDSNLRSPHPE